MAAAAGKPVACGLRRDARQCDACGIDAIGAQVLAFALFLAALVAGTWWIPSSGQRVAVALVTGLVLLRLAARLYGSGDEVYSGAEEMPRQHAHRMHVSHALFLKSGALAGQAVALFGVAVATLVANRARGIQAPRR